MPYVHLAMDNPGIGSRFNAVCSYSTNLNTKLAWLFNCTVKSQSALILFQSQYRLLGKSASQSASQLAILLDEKCPENLALDQPPMS